MTAKIRNTNNRGVKMEEESGRTHRGVKKDDPGDEDEFGGSL